MSSNPPPPPPPPPGPLLGYPAPPTGVPPYSSYGQPYFAPPPGPAPGLAYAGFWIRFAAYLIDALITFVPLVIIFFILVGAAFAGASCSITLNPDNSFNSGSCSNVGAFGLLAIPFIFFLFLPAAYFIVMWSWKGATVGQRALGVWVVDADTGTKISGGRAVLRYLGYIVNGAVFYLGFMWAGWDPRKQGWHDKIANTFVIKRA